MRVELGSKVKNRWRNGVTLNFGVQYVVEHGGDEKRVVDLHIHRTGIWLLEQVRELLMQPLVCKICSGYNMACKPLGTERLWLQESCVSLDAGHQAKHRILAAIESLFQEAQ